MTTPLHPTAQKVAEAARQYGLEIAIKEFTNSTRTAEDAAQAIGCHVAQIVKSLVFVVDGQPTMALVCGDNRLDEGKLAQVCNVSKSKIKRANADIVRAATGFAIGGVPPFGHVQSLPIYIDQDFSRFETIWAAAGTPNTVFSITLEELRRITEGQWVDLKVVE